MTDPSSLRARRAPARNAALSGDSKSGARPPAGAPLPRAGRSVAPRCAALAIAFAALVSPAPARAADCEGELPQQEMNRCAHEDWQRADHALNAEYRRARAFLQQIERDLPPDLRTGANDLRDAQRAWVTFRDKACLAEASLFKGGTMEPFLHYSCMARLTRQRTDDLGFIAE